MTPNGPRDLVVGDDYYILASSLAELPKLVLKHDEAFVVANQHGDLPRLPPSAISCGRAWARSSNRSSIARAGMPRNHPRRRGGGRPEGYSSRAYCRVGASA